MSDLNWQKSSFSEAAGTNCVYLAATPDGTVHLRESDSPATILTTTPEALANLMHALTTCTTTPVGTR
ncbi:DUF397 domain-containing protein [Streptomyces sp. NPDC029674]|uniref:DUF397 domain-containing protein n=1 Tax=Streptomyces sp. NPDC029674 TaxID=3365297 RepID=UPI003850E30C